MKVVELSTNSKSTVPILRVNCEPVGTFVNVNDAEANVLPTPVPLLIVADAGPKLPPKTLTTVKLPPFF